MKLSWFNIPSFAWWMPIFLPLLTVSFTNCAAQTNNQKNMKVENVNGQTQLLSLNEIKEIVVNDSVIEDQDPRWKNFVIKPEDVLQILKTYHQVTEEEWRHNYSHVLGGDRGGWINLKNGTKIKWMVRPAGLAMLIFSDDKKLYLAKELQN